MNLRCTHVRLATLFVSVALVAGQAGAAGSSSKSPPPPAPAPAPAPKPTPSPSATTRAVPATVPSGKISVSATVVPPAVAYKAATGNTPPAVPQLPAISPSQRIKSPAPSPASDRPSTKALAPTDSVEQASPAAWRRGNAPDVQAAGLSTVQAARLQPRLALFQQQYRDVEVVHEPTSSGWTWLFLYRALSNSERNAQLEQDNADLRARLDALEPQLRSDPVQWQQLQALAAAPSPSSPQADHFSEEDGPTTPQADLNAAENPSAEASAGNAGSVDRSTASLLQPFLILAVFAGGCALASAVSSGTNR